MPVKRKNGKDKKDAEASHNGEEGRWRLLGTRGKQWASIRLAKRIAFLLSN